jgi:zinc carboxypeptidase
MMRRNDPFGRLKTDPEDPRLMIPVKPGEKGEWTLLGQEGIDNDGDGSINEDSEGYVDGNRNWGFDWQPPYVQMGAGDYPFSGVGIKAIADYIRKRPNICLAYALHNTGGMYLRGPSEKGLGEYPPQDIAVYDYLGKQAERMNPGYRYMVSWKDLYTTYGDALEWIVSGNGAYGFVIELFQSTSETFHSHEEEKSRRPGEESAMPLMDSMDTTRERLKFNDHLAQGELYKPWESYSHPTYGEIEIGGWVKFSSRLPAPFMLKDLVHRNAMAMIFAAKQTPEPFPA